eukprot:1036150-Ditylum_brightwellii.AAC.1
MTWWAQLSAGTGVPILEEIHPLPYLEGKWLHQLLEDMQQIKCQIKLCTPWLPLPHQQGDHYIMDLMLNSPVINTSELDHIDWCLLYMQHLHVSDICTADRKALAHYCADPEPPIQILHKSEYDWPQQGRPNKTTWRAYINAIKKVLCKPNKSLSQPLRHFTRDSSKWSWRYHHKSTTLYHCIEDSWYCHSLQVAKRNYLTFDTLPAATPLPACTVPVTDVQISNTSIITRYPSKMAIREAEPEPRPKTFYQYIDTLAKWKQQLLSSIEFTMEEEDVIDILSETLSLYLVSNRGKESGLGYFGWVICTHTESLVQNKDHAADNPNLIESLCTESVGALSLLLFILQFCTYHNQKPDTDLWIHFCHNSTVI